MLLWHQTLPRKYALIERFNHGWVAGLPLKPGGKTLEIGAGLGAHMEFEDLAAQDYFCQEMREEFCEHLRRRILADRVAGGDIQQRQAWPDAAFDRVVAIHLLEHLTDLPAALREISRLLKPDGVFDLMAPCEGSLAYAIARKISAQRLFEREFKMDYIPIVRHEHVSTFAELQAELGAFFTVEKRRYFPFAWIPAAACNLVVGMRLRKIPGLGR
jgi:ubiquinone/menaquinone biosynthesis C-methylase UbiE